MKLSSRRIVFLERRDDNFSKILDQSPTSALWLFCCGFISEWSQRGLIEVSRHAFPVVELVCLEHASDWTFQRLLIYI